MADVNIDATILNDTGRGMRSMVFTTPSIGYFFYIDSDGTFGYSKTTDGGAVWGAQVEIAAATTHTSYDVWFDKWTPGDTGTLIHTWYVDTTNDDVTWRSLNTNGDTLAAAVQVRTLTSATAARGSFVSGTKARSGYLYVAYTIDASNEDGIQRSTDSGSTWVSNLDAGFMEATIDQCFLYPASNTGDNNDIWALYQDASADVLTVKIWDSSAGAAVESATIVAMAESVTDGQVYGFSGSIRHIDGHLIVASMSALDASTTHSVWDINGTTGAAFTITQLTDVQAATDDHYYPAVFIDQITDDIYIAYIGARGGTEVIGTTTKVYYTKSTDGGRSWSAGDTAYMEGAAAAIQSIYAPLMGPLFYVGWKQSAALVGNAVNSVPLTKLYLRNTQNHGLNTDPDVYYDMVPRPGSSADTAVTTTTASGTHIPITKTAGGSAVYFVSGRAPAGGFTITAADLSLWFKESAAGVNAGARVGLAERDPAGNQNSMLPGPWDDGVEFTGSDAEYTWTADMNDRVIEEDNRIVLKVIIANVGTMGAGTATMTFNAAVAATGDSFFQLVETVRFKPEQTKNALRMMGVGI